eukprot:gb/GECG01014987.1/.p1 GENE.gb/GECG01014987.1/~~gb/GECG01014987.1/.p1  ORF type:complete len:172 (+),score=17.58 gb/GECG01014987.1/:1-516(+)
MDCVQGEDNVQVVCRIRPLNENEKAAATTGEDTESQQQSNTTQYVGSKRRRSSVSSASGASSTATSNALVPGSSSSNKKTMADLKVEPDGQSVTLGKHKFTFDHTLGNETSQERVFQLGTDHRSGNPFLTPVFTVTMGQYSPMAKRAVEKLSLSWVGIMKRKISNNNAEPV